MPAISFQLSVISFSRPSSAVAFLESPIPFPQPFLPFLDRLFAFLRRTRRLEVQSGGGGVAEGHLGEEAGREVGCREELDEFVNPESRKLLPFFLEVQPMH